MAWIPAWGNPVITGSERALWHLVRQKFQLYKGHIDRVENLAGVGTPDVNIKLPDLPEFWLELKFIRNLPKRPDTIVPCKHFSLEQRLWMSTRAKAGGLAFVLLQIGDPRCYLLYRGEVAADLLGRCRWDALHRGALVKMPKFFDANEVIKCLIATT